MSTGALLLVLVVVGGEPPSPGATSPDAPAPAVVDPAVVDPAVVDPAVAPTDPTADGPTAADARRPADDAVPPLDDDDAELRRAPDAGMGDLISSFLKTMLMLALVIGFAYLTLHKGLGKMVAKAQQGQRVRVIERVPLGDRRSVVLVQLDGRDLLLGVSEGGIDVLDGAPDRARFASVLEDRRSGALAPRATDDEPASDRREDG